MIINNKNFAPIINRLAVKPKSICVALSGGADSVCLLHLLYNFYKATDTVLSAVHVNHNLRGEEADNDELFCRSLCNSLGIALKVFSVDVKAKRQKGEGLELAARRLRYAAFDEVEAQYIATAHNADDLLETFLMNFSRGCGLQGLTSIPEVRGKFIRPLLSFSREDILNYICENSLDYVTDSSNLTDEFTRNKLRHTVIPSLKEIYPEIVSVSARNINHLRNDCDYLEGAANRLFNNAYVFDSGLNAKILLSEHSALAYRAISRYTKLVTGSLPNSFFLEAMLGLCTKNNGSCELFDGFTAFIQNGFLCIENFLKTEFYITEEAFTTDNFKNALKINSLLLNNAIDCDKMVGKLTYRRRLPQDRIRPAGRGLSKSIRRLQNEVGLPKRLRCGIPIAVDDQGPLWGYMLGVDQRVAVDKNSKNIIVFSVKKSSDRGE